MKVACFFGAVVHCQVTRGHISEFTGLSAFAVVGRQLVDAPPSAKTLAADVRDVGPIPTADVRYVQLQLLDALASAERGAPPSAKTLAADVRDVGLIPAADGYSSSMRWLPPSGARSCSSMHWIPSDVARGPCRPLAL